MSTARLKARQVIKDYDIDNPSILVDHLDDLCFELGAAVRYEKLENAEARIIASNGKGIITVNSEEKWQERKRFSVGHELGHFLLHCGNVSEFVCNRKDMSDWLAKTKANNQEVEANEFSIELLMPENLVRPIVKAQKPNIEVIESLAENFKMSRSAAAQRYVEMSDEPVAVVFFNKAKGFGGLVKKSKYFEEQKYWFSAGPLDKESLAYDAVAGKAPSTMMSVAASAWIDLPSWLNDEVIMEQTRYYSNIDNGFSLLWIKGGPLIRN